MIKHRTVPPIETAATAEAVVKKSSRFAKALSRVAVRANILPGAVLGSAMLPEVMYGNVAVSAAMLSAIGSLPLLGRRIAQRRADTAILGYTWKRIQDRTVVVRDQNMSLTERLDSSMTPYEINHTVINERGAFEQQRQADPMIDAYHAAKGRESFASKALRYGSALTTGLGAAAVSNGLGSIAESASPVRSVAELLGGISLAVLSFHGAAAEQASLAELEAYHLRQIDNLGGLNSMEAL